MLLDVFTRNFRKLVAWQRLCAKVRRNLIKPFIEQKTANKRPIETQCILPEEERKSKKHHFLGIEIWQSTPLYSLCTFKSEASPCSFFILLSTECIKMHKRKLFCPKYTTFNGRNSCAIIDSDPLICFSRCHFLTLWYDLLEIHYENTPIQIYRKFYHQKMKIFR